MKMSQIEPKCQRAEPAIYGVQIVAENPEQSDKTNDRKIKMVLNATYCAFTVHVFPKPETTKYIGAKIHVKNCNECRYSTIEKIDPWE